MEGNATSRPEAAVCEDDFVNFLCEDLPQHGVLLVPPASEDYDPLLADIQRRLVEPADGSPPIPDNLRPRISQEDRPTSAILLNRSSKAIASLQVVWRFETETGRSYRHSWGMLSPQTLLLPFGRSHDSLFKLYSYWHTILPNSKRYLSESGMVGDNSDVRQPAEDEKWRGGVAGGGGRRGGSSRESARQITLVLDGVFFLDGEFVGPNRKKLFELTVADAEAHRIVARIAQDGHNQGLPPREILAAIERATGPAPERPSIYSASRNPDATEAEFRRAALQQIAFQLASRRRFPQLVDEEQTVLMVMGWNDVVLPRFRKG
jgi:hypothetical protein